MTVALDAYEEASRRLKDNPRSDFVGPRDTAVVEAAEKRLGFRFPESYRRFLLDFGCGNVGSDEIYGVIDSDVEGGPIPNATWLNLKRRERGFRPTLFVVYEAGDGSSHALDMEQIDRDGEAPVWLIDVRGSPKEKIAESFGQFLRELTG